jgi:hypothetical protein
LKQIAPRHDVVQQRSIDIDIIIYIAFEFAMQSLTMYKQAKFKAAWVSIKGIPKAKAPQIPTSGPL